MCNHTGSRFGCTTLMLPDTDSLAFLSGGGEMGQRIRACDWAATSLGPPARWPQALKTTIRLMLSTQHPVFVWWGPELIQFYNDAYSRSIGPERHPSALGQRGPECWAEIWHLIGWQIEQVMAGGEATWHQNQLVPITRFGQREDVYWTYSYSPIDEPSAPNGVGGVLVICTETTEKVLSEQRLREAEQRWRALFDQAPGFISILRGPDHVFEYANQRYVEFIGRRDFIGKPLGEVIPELESQGFTALLDEVYRSGRAHTGIATPIYFDGGTAGVRYRDFAYQPIRDEHGGVSAVLVIGFDVTERVLFAQRLEEADARKNAFMAMLGHELRSPLAGIHNAIAFLTRAEGGDPRNPRLIGMIQRQASHLTRLAEDLLDIASIAQGKMRLRTEPLDVAALLHEAIELAQPLLEEKHHQVTVEVVDEPLRVQGDRARLIQCIANVVTNAAKYTDTGGNIRLSACRAAGYAQITVSDNGIGIAPELLPHVFDLFTQGERGLSRSKGGLGIGLAIVKQLIALHGGEVGVSSEGVGRGTSFSLRIPAVQAP